MKGRHGRLNTIFMSLTSKIVMGVVILLLIGLAVYYFTKNPATAPSGDTATLPSGNDTSDAALDKDMQSLDTQINAFASDDTSIDSGLNDKQVEQSSL